MPVYLDKSKKRWRFEFDRIVPGAGRVRATKLLPKGWNRTQAEEFCKAEEARLYAVATGAEQRRTIEDAVNIYCKERLPHLKGAQKQARDLALVYWVYAGRYIDELPEVAREYAATATMTLKDGTEAPLAPATIRNRMAYLRAACRYAFKHHRFVDHDPAERLSLPAPKNERHHYASRADVLRIARKVSNRSARAAVLIAFYSGMRLDEVRRCQIEQDHFLLADTKNGERRRVPIHPKLRAYLPRMPIEAAARTIQQNFKLACIAVGMPHLHFHDLRHSAASAMINANVDLYTVGGVLGHKSAQSTKRYAHLATEKLAAAVATIGRKIHTAAK